MATPRKQWIRSATIAVDPDDGAQLVDITAPSIFIGGSKTPSQAGVAEPLVSESTPCRFVWVAAPIDNEGTATNTKPVFLGDSELQNMPLLKNNYRGVVIRIDDASKIYVRSNLAGDGVVYRITGEGSLEDNT